MVDDAARAGAAVGLVRAERGAARRELARALLRSTTFLAGSLIVGYWVFWALVGARLTPYDPFLDTDQVAKAPSLDHWFGTDQLGRDIFSRVHAGAADILGVAPLATMLGLAGGTAVGLIIGYFAGSAIEEVAGRVIDAVLALPVLVLTVVVIVALGNTSKTTQAVVIGVAFTPIIARTVRAAVLVERDLDYVTASRLRGERTPYILVSEILPNVTGPIIVEGTVRLGYAIFIVINLQFLGFGAQPPSPDWSLQIRENYPLLAGGGYWWTVLFPALAVCSLIVGVLLIADALQHLFDQ
jgi:peptide/nickel transport system permease protein